MPGGPTGWIVERLRLTAGSAALVTLLLVAVTVLRNVVVQARQPLGWGLASLTTAVLLVPLARRLGRVAGHGLAVALAVLGTAGVIVLLGARLVMEVRDQVDRIEVVLPEAARSLESDTGAGAVARDIELGRRVEEVVTTLGERVTQRATLERAVGTAPAYLVNLILVVFFLVWGRRMWNGLLRQLPEGGARARAMTAAEAVARGRWYVNANLVQGLVLGLALALVAWRLDLPAPAVLGLALGVWSLVPALGVVLGGVPALLLAGTEEPGWVTGLLALGLLVAQAGTILLARRVVHPRSVHVGPAVIVLAALLGSALYGLGGSAVVTVLTIFVVAGLDGPPPAVARSGAPPPDPF